MAAQVSLLFRCDMQAPGGATSTLYIVAADSNACNALLNQQYKGNTAVCINMQIIAGLSTLPLLLIQP